MPILILWLKGPHVISSFPDEFARLSKLGQVLPFALAMAVGDMANQLELTYPSQRAAILYGASL